MAQEDLRFIIDGPGELDVMLSHYRQEGRSFTLANVLWTKNGIVFENCRIKESRQFWPEEEWKQLCLINPGFFKRKSEIETAWLECIGNRRSLDNFAFEIEVCFQYDIYGPIRFFRAYYSLKTRKGILIFMETLKGDTVFMRS